MKRVACAVLLAVLAACGGRDAATTNTVPVDIALSPDSARHSGHTFSPDGQRLAYWTPAADSTQDWLLAVANVDLSAPTTFSVRSNVPEGPIWHPDGTRLAVVSSQYGSADVVLVTLASGEATRATKDAGIELPLHWSRDGRTLTYLRTTSDGSFRTDVLTIADGTTRPMLPGESRPHSGEPSPDGARVAYMLGDGSKYTIWVADSLGGNRQALTTEGFEEELRNSWSPDGKEVLYVSTRTGTADIWAASISGSAPRQITRNVRRDFAGAWSPDGQWIAFLSDRGKQTDVWVVPAAGGEERRVTNSAAEERGPLRWRPGTTELTFNVEREKSGLWVVDVDSGKERQLTADSVLVSDFWSSPDGKQVAVVIERGGGVRELALVPTSGGAMRTLVSVQADLIRPLFSPDGAQLTYWSDAAGSYDVWLVDVAGGAPRQLTNWPGIERVPVWSKDGTEVLFLSDRDSRLADVWKVSATGGEPTRLTRDGGVLLLLARAGYPGIYAQRVSGPGGQIGVARLQEDGRLQTVWDRSNTGRYIPLSEDSVVVMVEQPDGSMRGMLLSAAGGGGRVILKPNENLSWGTVDASQVAYYLSVNGANDLGLLTLADGTVRRLTTSPENEDGAEMTPDGKSVVFLRKKLVQRIHSVDVQSLLTARSRGQSR